jgi:hypothetical protein
MAQYQFSLSLMEPFYWSAHFGMESSEKPVQNLGNGVILLGIWLAVVLAKLKCDLVIYIIKSHKI